MKNFFKKLSFVMAAAMVVTSLHVPAEAKAASKDYVFVKGSKKAVTAKSLFVGGQSVNFDYVVGSLKNKGANGKWTVEDSSIATVDKAGVVKAVGVGETTLIFTAKKSKKVKKAVEKKVKIMTYARAEAVVISPAALEVVKGKKVDADVMLTVKEELEKAGVKSSYMTFAEIDNASAAAVKVEAGKLMVEAKEETSTPATITVYAAQKDTLEAAKANKYVKKAEVKLTVKSELMADQLGANKVLVKGENLSGDKKDYTLKSAKGANFELKEVKLNEAKTEAVLVTDALQIFPGKYVLTYNKKDLELEIVKSVVKSIKLFPEDKVIAFKDIDNKYSKAYITYKVLDQFGDDVTDSNLYTLNISSSVDASDDKKGTITFTNRPVNSNAVPKAFSINFDRVSLVVLDKKTGTLANGIFTVSDETRVNEVEYVGLYSADDKKMVSSFKETDTNKTFQLLFALKDQYGKQMLINNASDSIKVHLSSAANVKVDETAKIVKIGDKSYTAFSVAPATGTSYRAGMVDILAIGLFNGKSVTGNFEVTHGNHVDKLIVSEPTSGVYNGEENSLIVTAYDLDGKEVTDLNLLNKVKFVSHPNLFTFTKNKEGKVRLTFNPNLIQNNTELKGSQSLFVTYKTMTNKLGNFSLKVNNTRIPTKLKGFKDDMTNFATTKTHDLNVNLNSLVFSDQYGNDITAQKIGGLYNGKYAVYVDYTAAAEANVTAAIADVFGAQNPNKITLTDNLSGNYKLIAAIKNANSNELPAKITVYWGETTKVETYKLNKTEDNRKALEATTATAYLYNLSVSQLENFSIGDVEVQPAADLYTNKAESEKNKRTYTLNPNVYGMYKGVKVKLHRDITKEIGKASDGEDENADYSIIAGVKKADNNNDKLNFDKMVAGQNYVKVPDKAEIKTGDTATASFEVNINNGKGSRVSKTYTYSKELFKVSKVEYNGEIITASSALKWSDIKSKFTVEDQYKKSSNAEPYITYVELIDDSITITNNGTKEATITCKSGTVVPVLMKLTFADSIQTNYEMVVYVSQ